MKTGEFAYRPLYQYRNTLTNITPAHIHLGFEQPDLWTLVTPPGQGPKLDLGLQALPIAGFVGWREGFV